MTASTLTACLIFSAGLFGIGIAGIFIHRKSIIMILLCLELMLLAVNTNFIAFAQYAEDLAGQILVFFVLTLAAIKTAIGLAILVLLFKRQHKLSIAEFNSLQG